MEKAMQSSEIKTDLLSNNPPLDMKKWREFIYGWELSQESQKNYCKRLGISFNTFSYARSKLLQKENMHTKFIPLEIKTVDKKILDPSLSLFLENYSGLKLHISHTLPVEQLSKILKACGWLHD
jgi:hypothetical protein